MKNLFYLLFLIVCFGCNPNNPSPNSANRQWEVTIDGQNYSWSGTYTPGLVPPADNSGNCNVVNEPQFQPMGFTGLSDNGSTTHTLVISLPSYATGTYTCSQANYSNSNFVAFDTNGGVDYSTAWGGSITVVVSECPSDLYETASCTFSGTIGRSPNLGGGTVSISGSMDAVRMY